MADQLEDVILGAYERRRQQALDTGGPELSVGSFVDEQAQRFDAAGQGDKAKKLRDWRAQKQAGQIQETAKASTDALEAATQRGIAKTYGRVTPGTQKELEIVAGERAEQATGGMGRRARPSTPGGFLGPTGLEGTDPSQPAPVKGETAKDLLESLGHDTSKMTAAEVFQRYGEEFGNQVNSERAGQTVRRQTWAARAAQVQQELQLPGDDTGVDFSDPDLARTYVKAAEAEDTARRLGILADRPGVAAGALYSAKMIREGSLGLINNERMLGLGKEGGRALTEAEETFRAGSGASGRMTLDTAGVLATLPAFKGMTAALGRGFAAAKIPAHLIPALSEPVSMGIVSGLGQWNTRDPETGERGSFWKGAAHGATMSAIGAPLAHALGPMLTKLPPRLANALSQSAGFLAGDFVAKAALEGRLITPEEAFQSAMLGLALGAQSDTPTTDAETLQQREIVRNAMVDAGILVIDPASNGLVPNPMYRQQLEEAAASRDRRGPVLDLGVAGPGPAPAPGAPRPPGQPLPEVPVAGGGTMGPVVNRRTGARGELVRGVGAGPDRQVQVRDGGGDRMVPAGDVEAASTRPARTAPADPPPPAKVLEGARRLAANGWGDRPELVTALERRFGVDRETALRTVEVLAEEGMAPRRLVHEERMGQEYGEPGKKPRGGKKPVAAYNATRRELDKALETKEGDAREIRGRMRAAWERLTPADRQKALEHASATDSPFQRHEAFTPEGEPAADLPVRETATQRRTAEEAATASRKPQEPAAEPPPEPPPPPADGQGAKPTPPEPAPAPAAPPAPEAPALRGPRSLFGSRHKPKRLATPEERTMAESIVTERRRANQADVEKFSDTTTGLQNQNAWKAYAPRAEGPGRKVWTGDLGEFKALNDALGHAAGDLALGKVGARLKEAAKAAGIDERNVFRSGVGDEFTVAGTTAQVEAFEKALGENPGIEHGGRRVHIDGASAETFKDADAASGAAKAARKKKAGIGTREQEATKAAGGKNPETTPKEPAPKERDLEAAVPRPPIPKERRRDGNETEIRGRDGQTVKGRYAVIELDDLRTSHDPTKSFAWREGYPREVQERDYSADRGEQQKVIGLVGRFKPAEVINTAPGATDGPPSTAPDGSVLNGNGRGMGIHLLSRQGRFAEYETYLVEHAGDFGIDRSTLGDFEKPVLVRVVDMDATSKEAIDFARTGNESATREVSPLTAAARNITLMGEGVLEAVRSDPTTTVAKVVNGSGGAAFRKALRDALPDAQRPKYVNEDGSLTGAGEELAGDMILLRGLSEPGDAKGVQVALERLGRMPASMRRALSDSAVQLMELRKTKDGEQLVEGMLEASDYWTLVMGRENPDAWRTSMRQSGFAEPAMSPLARGWIDWLHGAKDTPKKFRDALTALVQLEKTNDAETGGLLADQAKPVDVVARLARVLDGWRPTEGATGVLDNSGGFLFGSPIDSPERLAEFPDAFLAPMPDPITFETPDVSNGYAMDLPSYPTAAKGWRGRGIPMHDVIQELERLIEGIPIRSTGFSPQQRKQAAGYFIVRPELVRLRYANDIPTAIHEAGHAIEKLVWWNIGKPGAINHLPLNVRSELYGMGRALYQGRPAAGGYLREGFAELMRGLFTTRPDVNVVAPNTVKWFTETFLKDHPQVAKRLARARKKFDQWFAQGREGVYAAQVRDKPYRSESRAARLRALKSIKTRMVESGDVISEMVDLHRKRTGPLPLDQDPEAILTSTRLLHTALTRQMAYVGMLDPMGNITGPPLVDGVNVALASGEARGWSRKETRRRFTLYLWGRRAIERIGRGMHPGMSEDVAHRFVEDYGSPEFDIAAKRVYDWNRKLLEYPVKAGVLSPAEVKAIFKGSTDYIPLQRVVDVLGRGPADRATRGGSPLQRFRGSGEAIRDPFQAMIENAEKIVHWTHERMVIRALVKMAPTEGMGRYIVKVRRDLEPKAVELDKLRKQLEDAGADLTGVDPATILTYFSPAIRPPKGKPWISHMDAGSGKVTWYEVDPRIYEALEGLDIARLPKWVDAIFGRAKRGLAMGATGFNATFGLLTNPLRDAPTGFLQSKTSKNPITYVGEWGRAWAQSLGAAFGKGGHYTELFERLGLPMSNPLGVDTQNTRRAVRELFAGKGAGGAVRRVLRTPLEHLRDVLQFAESATRTAELRRIAKEVGYVPGQPITMEQSIAMRIGTKRITTDFTASGTWGRAINQVVPFLNSNIQGLRSLARTFKQNPAAGFLKGLSMLTLPTLALWWKYKDEDWYKRMPWREKLSSWHFPVGKQMVKIPRPFDWGVWLSALPEAAADSLYRKDPESFRQGLGHLFENSPLKYAPWSPTRGVDVARPLAALNPLVGGPLEVGINRDTHQDRSIEPENERGIPPAQRVAPYSSGLSRWLSENVTTWKGEGGKKEGLSPRQLDHLMRAFSGGLIHNTADILDALTGSSVGRRARSGREPADIPVLGSLFRRGGKEGTGDVNVDRLFDRLAGARQRNADRQTDETNTQRQERLALEDASKAIRFLRQLQNVVSSQGERQAIQREVGALAERALRDAGRRRFAGEASRAESRAKSATTPAGGQRRIGAR